VQNFYLFQDASRQLGGARPFPLNPPLHIRRKFGPVTKIESDKISVEKPKWQQNVFLTYYSVNTCSPILCIYNDIDGYQIYQCATRVNRCEKQNKCSLNANDETFGGTAADPCPHTSKYLQVIFLCEPGKEY